MSVRSYFVGAKWPPSGCKLAINTGRNTHQADPDGPNTCSTGVPLDASGVAFRRGGWWRHAYPRPEGVHVIGTAAVQLLIGSKKRAADRAAAREKQRELHRRTGFAGGAAELGHVVTFELRKLGYAPNVAEYGGHLCSVGGRFNFQGNPRLAELMGRSLRSAQRYRAQLELDGLIQSCTLEPGDMVDGQRAPVLRPQVVRDLTALRALGDRPLAPPHERTRNKRRRRKGPSAAELVPPPPAEHMTADDWHALRELAPEWLKPHYAERADAAERYERSTRQKTITEATEERGHPEFSNAELDALDRELAELTDRRKPDTPKRE